MFFFETHCILELYVPSTNVTTCFTAIHMHHHRLTKEISYWTNEHV